MKTIVAAFLAAFLFALGLGVSGMMQPAKVLGFLDVFGAWDPSLMFVMVGAIGVYLPLSRLILRRRAPLLAAKFAVPGKKTIDPRLIGGAVIFGIGWGLGGFCPGPAVVGLAQGSAAVALFVTTMLLGMGLYSQLPRLKNANAPEP